MKSFGFTVIITLAQLPGYAVAAWLIAEGDRDTASLLTSGKVSVTDALPLPHAPSNLEHVEVLPAPLSLQSEKPDGAPGDVPWWAQPIAPTKRFDARGTHSKLKRPEDDLFVTRESESTPWTAFRPARRVRLRNGRPDPKQPEPSLFAIEQIVEETYFLAELHGSVEDMKQLAEKLAEVLNGRRWLRVGRAGAPVEVAQLAWAAARDPKPEPGLLLTLTSDLLVRDERLRWRTRLDATALKELLDPDVQFAEEASTQDSVMVHGFNGTSRLWRMPAAAIRRGSVFVISGPGIAKVAQRAARGEWLGERTHEGFGRFRIDATLPGATTGEVRNSEPLSPVAYVAEEAIAKATREWFEELKSLADPDQRAPSLSHWLDLVGELEADNKNALTSRLNPQTAGAKSWKHGDAKAILDKLRELPAPQQRLYARLFVRWLRVALRKKTKGAP